MFPSHLCLHIRAPNAPVPAPSSHLDADICCKSRNVILKNLKEFMFFFKALEVTAHSLKELKFSSSAKPDCFEIVQYIF